MLDVRRLCTPKRSLFFRRPTFPGIVVQSSASIQGRMTKHYCQGHGIPLLHRCWCHYEFCFRYHPPYSSLEHKIKGLCTLREPQLPSIRRPHRSQGDGERHFRYGTLVLVAGTWGRRPRSCCCICMDGDHALRRMVEKQVRRLSP